MGNRNALRRWFDIFSFGAFGAIAVVASAALLFQRHSFFTAILIGVLWASVAHGLAWGLAEVVAPAWVIQRRQRLVSRLEDWRKPVGRYFSERLRASEKEPWKSPRARRRIRLLGAFLTAFWLLVAAALVWLPGLLDSLFSRLPQPIR